MSALAQIVGKAPWAVAKGHGSFLTFDFGARHVDNSGAFGEYHLWIYMCHWRITNDGNELAHNESATDVISNACTFLQDKELLAVKYGLTVRNDGTRSTSRFEFADRVVLETVSYEERQSDEANWMLIDRSSGWKCTAFLYDATLAISDANGRPVRKCTHVNFNLLL
ncbi:MAG: hypothetical protein K0Q55_2230 [Verrucomicrobia bacterium]|jgi:hypothetical protein|nr:hypothetical protein [Verrucomicrobiota bacterium]